MRQQKSYIKSNIPKCPLYLCRGLVSLTVKIDGMISQYVHRRCCVAIICHVSEVTQLLQFNICVPTNSLRFIYLFFYHGKLLLLMPVQCVCV